MKRGISPATSLTTSLSNTRLRESESNYSIKNSAYATSNENHRNAFTMERTHKASNGPKSVNFASDIGGMPSTVKSSSSYSISEQLKITLPTGLNASTPTSQLIKQTLSPLTQHRTMQQKQSNVDMTNSPQKIQSNHTSALGSSYQFSSNSLNTSSKPPIPHTNHHHHHHHHQSSSASNDNNATATTTTIASSSIHKSSSPSKTLGSNHTSTLPSNIARNMLYQSESSYSHKNQPQSNFTSPGNGIGVGGGVTTLPLQSNNIYGTLPKSSGAFSGFGTSTGGSHTTANSSIYGNVSAVANEFEQIIARNASSASSTHANPIGAGNYNTLGSYRVQYSSTNPFLPSFNPQSTEMNATNHDDK